MGDISSLFHDEKRGEGKRKSPSTCASRRALGMNWGNRVTFSFFLSFWGRRRWKESFSWIISVPFFFLLLIPSHSRELNQINAFVGVLFSFLFVARGKKSPPCTHPSESIQFNAACLVSAAGKSASPFQLTRKNFFRLYLI